MTVPEGWSKTILGQVACQSTERFDPTSGDCRPYVGLEHIVPECPVIPAYGRSDATTSLKTVFQPGDILFGKLRPYLRKAARADRAGVCSTDVLAIRVSGDVEPSFLYAVTSTDRAFNYAASHSAGTKMPRTSWRALAEFEILLPPLPEQRKIAAILSSVDDAIQTTQAAIEQTKRVKQGLLQELLTKGIGHTRFKQTEVGEVPEEWEVVRISQLGTVAYGLTVNKDRRLSGNRVQYLTVANVDNGRINLNHVRDIGMLPGDIEKYALKQGDVLLVEGNANVDLLGRPVQWLGQVPVMLHQNHLLRVRLDTDKALPTWLCGFLNTRQGREQIIRQAKTSSGLNTINSKVVSELLVAAPPLSEQRETVRRLAATDRVLGAVENEEGQLRALKSGLLQDLLTGNVRVQP